MRARSCKPLETLGVFLISLSVGLAQGTASTNWSFLITGASDPVYDLSGGYRFDQPFETRNGGSPRLSYNLSLKQDAVGRLQGSGSTTVRLGSTSYDANYQAGGRVSGGGIAGTRVVLIVRLTSPTSASVQPLELSVQYHLQATPAGLNGTVRGGGRLAEWGPGTIRSLMSGIPLPPGMDGSWKVQWDAAGESAAGETGSILISNGRSVEAQIRSSRESGSALQQVSLAGTSQDRGNTLNMSLAGQPLALKKAHGRILGQSVSGALVTSQIAGSVICSECHSPVYQAQTNTFHGVQGVQCEDCHGAAYAHAANDYDPTARPKVDFTGTACGKCHSGPRHPTYEDWSLSGHSQMAVDLNNTNLTVTCGQCHSGSVRVNLLDALPIPPDAVNVPVGCPTCHETHSNPTNAFLLRGPLASTNDYFLPPDAVIDTNYNPGVNLCAQCHNDRGASWTVTDRAPHHSLQYNMLLGSVGEQDSGLPPYQPASHALLITNQCAGCHMQTSPYQSVSQPADTGHQFTVNSFNLCTPCHSDPPGLVQLTQNSISNQVDYLKFALDYWATTKASPELSSKYGARAWEYTIPGDLSPGGPGPDATEQALIPDTIKKARFNLYLVLYDGSLGVHNGPYAVGLLDTALNWVTTELNN